MLILFFRCRKYQCYQISSENPGVVMVQTSKDIDKTTFCLPKNTCFRFTETDRPVPQLALDHLKHGATSCTTTCALYCQLEDEIPSRDRLYEAFLML
ncbi:hypothetical protein DPMN_147267 [Dreissena polymorpha]|uniref:Uncharacterized protein n=1 Tax=Dreissena polymorpha TaxID=45954 RepID=A0A9D4F828_DREPO|nr:hypothetical protein DPMN_147267 [Dreissena polymorpha]